MRSEEEKLPDAEDKDEPVKVDCPELELLDDELDDDDDEVEDVRVVTAFCTCDCHIS